MSDHERFIEEAEHDPPAVVLLAEQSQVESYAPTIVAYVEAHYRVYGDRAAARELLRPFAHHLQDAGLGSISEILEGDPPHLPRGCIAQAWGVAEVLRVWRGLYESRPFGASEEVPIQLEPQLTTQ